MLDSYQSDANLKQEKPIYCKDAGGGNTPLHLATLGNHADVVRYLIQAGSDVNAANEFGNTPLHIAAIQGHVEVLKLLVEEGKGDISIKNIFELTPLQLVLMCGEDDLAGELHHDDDSL